jgi:hypothetical protein
MKILHGRMKRAVPKVITSISNYHIQDAAITNIEDSKVSSPRERSESLSALKPTKSQRTALITKALILITPRPFSDAAKKTAIGKFVASINKQAEQIVHTKRTFAMR